MTAIVLQDFAGGIQEDHNQSAADYTPRQWAQLKGFVLENEISLRSQPALQSISTRQDMRSVFAFEGRKGRWLIGINRDGYVLWTAAPDETAGHAATTAITWNNLRDQEGLNGAAPHDPKYRFLCVQPYYANTQGNLVNKPAVRIHCLNGASSALMVFETEVAGGYGLSFDPYTDFSPESEPAVSGGPPVPKGGKYPRANVAAVANDLLYLGDVFYYRNGPADANALAGKALTSENGKHWPNAMWHTFSYETDKFLTIGQTVSALSADVTIVGLAWVESGLLVFTTAGSGRGGVVLIRGPLDSQDIEVLRVGMGAAKSTEDVHRPYQTFWGETGAVVFIDHLGGCWATDGEQVQRIDRYGPLKPARATMWDHVAACGPYLLMYRDGRLLVMRQFMETGAWTELALPTLTPYAAGAPKVRSMSALGSDVYMVLEDGRVARLAFANETDRGTFDGQPLDLVLGTATQNADSDYDTKLWRRVGVRLQGLNPAARLKSLTNRAGSWFSDAPSVEYALDQPVGRRELVVVDGVGPSVESSAGMVVNGDVRVETVQLDYSTGAPAR